MQKSEVGERDAVKGRILHEAVLHHIGEDQLVTDF